MSFLNINPSIHRILVPVVRVPFVFVNAEASALVARMPVKANDARKTLIDNLIGSLKAAGVWSKLDVLYVLAAHHEGAALLEWKGNTSYNAVKTGTPTFTTNKGFTGNVTGDYLATGYIPATNSLGMTLDDSHIGIYTLTHNTSSSRDFGLSTSTHAMGSGTTGKASINIRGGVEAPVGEAPHHIVGTRTALNNIISYRNGVAGTPLTTGQATGILANQIVILSNTAGGAVSGRQVSIAHFGRALTPQQCIDAHAAFTTYLTGVGALT